jgi:anti-sigma factor RsiW
MKCRECVEFLIDYLEGELPPEQAEAFQQHLELCPPCIEYVATYKSTIEIGRICCKHEDRSPPDMPEALVRAILKARTGDCADASGGVGE